MYTKHALIALALLAGSLAAPQRNAIALPHGDVYVTGTPSNQQPSSPVGIVSSQIWEIALGGALKTHTTENIPLATAAQVLASVILNIVKPTTTPLPPPPSLLPSPPPSPSPSLTQVPIAPSEPVIMNNLKCFNSYTGKPEWCCKINNVPQLCPWAERGRH